MDYKQIIDDLWAEQISADEQEDASPEAREAREARDRRIKKTIANINFGLLEKITQQRAKEQDV